MWPLFVYNGYLCGAIASKETAGDISTGTMNFAVIAAGEGSRLALEGVQQHKPLVPVGGVPLIERQLDMFCKANAQSICVIVNEQMPEVSAWLNDWKKKHMSVDLQLMVQSTPSSMHSFAALMPLLPVGKLILTTVDTLYRERDFLFYVRAWEGMSQEQGDGLMGVTPFVDDEKPLWVDVDSQGRIQAFLDQQENAHLVSGGIYGLNTQTAFPVLNQCLAEGQSRMRNFQRALIDQGLCLKAHVFADRIMDIDHMSDIHKAEEWLSTDFINISQI